MSLWTQNLTFPAFQALDKSLQTDVLIIGGGITGILCAHYLQQAGISYVLLEADTICSGITQNTTAKITSQHGLIYHKLLKSKGEEKTRLYYEANDAALKEYRTLAEQNPCDFENKNNFVYSTNNKKKLFQELTALEKLAIPAFFTDKLPLPVPVAGAICFKDQAQFHPLKLLAALAKPLHIYEHTRVKELIGNAAFSGSHRILAKEIIVTTHFPLLNKHGSYFLKQYQQRSYVLALANAAQVSGMYIDDATQGYSFRNYQNLLLLGGGGHRTGKQGGGGHRTGKQGGGWEELRSFAKTYFPQATETAHWATQDCMTIDGIPYIGQYSERTPHLYVATGYNKWGMTSAMTAALLLRDLILGRTTPYARLFSPSRSILQPKLFSNAAEAALNLLTPTRPRCPHLGCALKWNQAEHSWDCPCHGSRFTEDGILLDNPATKNIDVLLKKDHPHTKS